MGDLCGVALLAPIPQGDDCASLKTVPETALQRIIDYDVQNLIGAAPNGRNPD
jgi:hypothetical protein